MTSTLRDIDNAGKEALVREAFEILRREDLGNLEKAVAIDEIRGFGPNISTGLLLLLAPEQFEIWNEPSKEVLGRLGYAVDDLAQFQEGAAALKTALGADDFLEFDWYPLRLGGP